MKQKIYKAICFVAGAGIGLLVGLASVALIDAVMGARFGDIHDTSFDAGDIILVLFDVVVCGLLIGYGAYRQFFGDKYENVLLKIAKYDSSSKILSITKRAPELSELIYVREYIFTDLSYNDPTLVYTGATVGGVTTGGFHVEGGDYDQKLSRSGKYQLVYKDPISKTESVINGIKLPQLLISSAAGDYKISKYLDGDMIVPFSKEKMNDAFAKLARDSVASGNMAMAFSAAQRANIDKLLTQDECSSIKQWLCSTY